MDTDHLRMYLHLCHSRHFGRTARQFDCSASTLTRIVQRLERDVGMPLLERDKHQVSVTAAGERFANFAKTQLRSWEDLCVHIRADEASLTGDLRCYSAMPACSSMLPELLQRFRNDHPGIRLMMEAGHAERAMHRLMSGEADIAITAVRGKLPADVHAVTILQTPVIAVVQREQTDLPPKPWTSESVILPTAGVVRQALDAWFDEQHITPHIYDRVNNDEAMLALVSMGFGIGFLPNVVVEHSILHDRIRRLRVLPRLPRLTVACCVQKRRRKEPRIAALLEVLPGYGRQEDTY